MGKRAERGEEPQPDAVHRALQQHVLLVRGVSVRGSSSLGAAPRGGLLLPLQTAPAAGRRRCLLHPPSSVRGPVALTVNCRQRGARARPGRGQVGARPARGKGPCEGRPGRSHAAGSARLCANVAGGGGGRGVTVASLEQKGQSRLALPASDGQWPLRNHSGPSRAAGPRLWLPLRL